MTTLQEVQTRRDIQGPQALPAQRYCAFVAPQTPHHLAVAQAGRDGIITPQEQMDLQAAYVITKRWPQNYTIKFEFLEGTEYQKNLVRQVVMETYQPHINLKLEFYDRGDIEKSDCRITFDPDGGAWSFLGTDAWNYGQDQATINLGWLDNPPNNTDKCCYGVIKHEFGHCIGPWIHEHQNPDPSNPLSANWNRDVVIADLSGPPNDWDEETIEDNIFKRYDRKTIRGTKWDKNSIMEYFYPAAWTKNNVSVPVNQKLSVMDIAFLKKTYPKKNTASEQQQSMRPVDSAAHEVNVSDTRDARRAARASRVGKAIDGKKKPDTTTMVLAILAGVLGLALIIWIIVCSSKKDKAPKK